MDIGIDEGNGEERSWNSNASYQTKKTESSHQNEANKSGKSIDENIDEVEEALAKLKRELGL